MKKFLLTLLMSFLFTLSAHAYSYQWNVPYDNHGRVYPNNVQGGYYMGGRTPEYQKVKPQYRARNYNLDRARNKPRKRNKY